MGGASVLTTRAPKCSHLPIKIKKGWVLEYQLSTVAKKKLIVVVTEEPVNCNLTLKK